MKLPGKTNTFRIYIKTALESGIKARIIDNKNRLAELSKGNKKVYLYNMMLPFNDGLSTLLSRQKYLTKKLLQKKEIAVASDCQVANYDEALKKMAGLSFPLVVKPVVGGRGKGITTNISSKSELKKAIKRALSFSNQVLIEEVCKGDDYRFLVLKGKVIGIVSRQAPFVTGDNKHTLKELINKHNQEIVDLNNKNNEVILRKIRINNALEEVIEKQGFSLKSIPPKGKKVILAMTANWSTGGLVRTFEQNDFHPSTLDTAIKILKIMQLNFAAIDFIIANPSKPLNGGNGVFLEVNSYPGINVYHHPTYGKPQKVASAVLTSCLTNDRLAITN